MAADGGARRVRRRGSRVNNREGLQQPGYDGSEMLHLVLPSLLRLWWALDAATAPVKSVG